MEKLILELKDYLHKTFPGLSLKPSLYVQWDTGVHIEFAKGLYQLNIDDKLNPIYFEKVYNQALSLFHLLFGEEDEIFLVTNVYHHKDWKWKQSKVYRRYVKNKHLTYDVKKQMLPYLFIDEDEGDGYVTSQFNVRCRKSDINYSLLLKATCHEDFPIQPKLGKAKDTYYPDVFFVNATQDLIFFIYDDRGCEVVASHKDTLQSITKWGAEEGIEVDYKE